MRDIQNINRNNKSSILMKDKEDNVPGSNIEKIKVIEDYFKSTLAPEETKEEIMEVPPCKMKKEFSADEIKKLAQRLNNDKASGPDQLKVEYIKYLVCTQSTHQQIAEIYNSTAETGDSPLELIHGLLHPKQKVG